MIYFVQAGVRGPVKIGKAKNVAARVSELATGHYERLSILATLDVSDEIETKLHRLLKAHRMNREWFSWCPEVERVADLAKQGRLPEFPREKQKRQNRSAAERAARFVMPNVPEGTLAWWIADTRRQLIELELPSRVIADIAGVDAKTVRNVLGGDDPSVKTFDALLAAWPALKAEAVSRFEAA